MRNDKTLQLIVATTLTTLAAQNSHAFYNFTMHAGAGIVFTPQPYQDVNEDNGVTRVSNDLVNNWSPFYSECRYNIGFGDEHEYVKTVNQYAFALITSTLTDTIHVRSNDGSPVTLRLDLPTHGTITHSGQIAVALAQADIKIDGDKRLQYIDNINSDGTLFHAKDPAFTLTVASGSSFSLAQSFSLQANPGPLQSSVEMDYSNTSRVTIDVLSAGGSFTSDSGATYSSAVPEPASIAALAIVVLGVAKRRKRV